MFFLTLFYTVLYNIFQCFFHRSKLKFIIIKSYEYFKLVQSNPQLNPVELFRTHCYSYYYVSYHLQNTNQLNLISREFDISSASFGYATIITYET